MLLTLLAGCGGDTGFRIGSDYANVAFSGRTGYNGSAARLARGQIESSSTPLQTTEVATEARTDISRPPRRAITLVYDGDARELPAAPLRRVVDLAEDGPVTLTYAEPGDAVRVWRARSGIVSIARSGGAVDARFTDLVLEPDATVAGNTARGALRLSGFLDPGAPQ